MPAGVQFPPVHYNGDTFLPGQANNFYIYPAIGLAIYATRAKLVTDEIFIEAARALADQVNEKQLKMGLLFPPQSNILGTEVQTAEHLAAVIFERNLARINPPPNGDINSWLQRMLFKPEYTTLLPRD